MITVDEMRKLLKEEFGINSEQELDRELKKLGGIDIAIFTKKPSKEALELVG